VLVTPPLPVSEYSGTQCYSLTPAASLTHYFNYPTYDILAWNAQLFNCCLADLAECNITVCTGRGPATAAVPSAVLWLLPSNKAAYHNMLFHFRDGVTLYSIV
jgi:hypothetical protein